MNRWRALQAFGAVAVVATAAWQLQEHAHELQAPAGFSSIWILLAIVAQAGVSLSNNLLAHGHLKMHGHAVPFVGLLRINLFGSLLNLLLPLGLGMLLRGAWLHVRHELPLSRAGRHLLETNLLVFTVNLWLMALLVAAYPGSWPIWLGLVGSAIAIACLPHARPLIGRTLLPYPCAALANIALAQGLDLHLSWEFLFMLPLLVHASALVVLAPGALAVTESLFVLAATAFAAPIGDALWLALASRATGLTAVTVLLLGLHVGAATRRRSITCHQ